MQLKDTAGWNQTEQDWLRLLELEPAGCFGIECDGRLAATTMAVCYGDELAWIGMVITLPEFRRRGLGRALMRHTIEFLARRGVRWIKLDATDMGAPLYREFGFETEGTVERWLRPGSASRRFANPQATLEQFRIDEKLDREAFGADRAQLLARLAGVESAAIPGQGYAMGRPGSVATYFGPCVATSAGAARGLLEWFLSRHAGEPVFWDLLAENREAVGLAVEYGFERARRLARMALRGTSDAPPLSANNRQTFAIAGLEYG